MHTNDESIRILKTPLKFKSADIAEIPIIFAFSKRDICVEHKSEQKKKMIYRCLRKKVRCSRL